MMPEGAAQADGDPSRERDVSKGRPGDVVAKEDEQDASRVPDEAGTQDKGDDAPADSIGLQDGPSTIRFHPPTDARE